MNHISIEKLIKAGAHFGHPTSRWHPGFSNYICMKKNGVHIIDLEQTSQCMIRAAQAIGKIVKSDGNILFVGTKKQAKDVVQQAADRCGMYYIVERWLGGTLTNYGTIKKSIKRLTILEKESSEIYDNLTKKELNMLERERLRLADLHRPCFLWMAYMRKLRLLKQGFWVFPHLALLTAIQILQALIILFRPMMIP